MDGMNHVLVGFQIELVPTGPHTLYVAEDPKQLLIQHDGHVITTEQYCTLRAIETLYPETKWTTRGSFVVAHCEKGHFIIWSDGGYKLVTPDGFEVTFIDDREGIWMSSN